MIEKFKSLSSNSQKAIVISVILVLFTIFLVLSWSLFEYSDKNSESDTTLPVNTIASESLNSLTTEKKYYEGGIVEYEETTTESPLVMTKQTTQKQTTQKQTTVKPLELTTAKKEVPTVPAVKPVVTTTASPTTTTKYTPWGKKGDFNVENTLKLLNDYASKKEKLVIDDSLTAENSSWTHQRLTSLSKDYDSFFSYMKQTIDLQYTNCKDAGYMDNKNLKMKIIAKEQFDERYQETYYLFYVLYKV